MKTNKDIQDVIDVAKLKLDNFVIIAFKGAGCSTSTNYKLNEAQTLYLITQLRKIINKNFQNLEKEYEKD